ncbi:MAG: DUF3604 domain-containing protein [Planctomycetes bacterium]|nr:DUF3604 domain-containing protein [Planctomycetota bacterium]
MALSSRETGNDSSGSQAAGDHIELTADQPVRAGRFTTLRLRITLATELAAHSKLCVFWPYGFSLPQLTKPQSPGYVIARAASGVALELAALEVSPGREYMYAVCCRARNGALGPGEELEFVLGDTSAGSPGVRASVQALSGVDVACYRMTAGNPHPPRLRESPRVTIESCPAVVVRGLATPSLGLGEKGRLKLVAEDEYGNRDRNFTGRVALLGISGLAGIASEAVFTKADEGYKEIEFTAEVEGVHHPVVSGPGGDLEIGPVVVLKDAPEYRLYFGELHCHTEISCDGCGTLDDFYRFARDTAGLDFAAATDHMTWAGNRTGFETHPSAHPDDDRSKRTQVWRATAEAARRYHQPGRFVTFLGTEADTTGLAGHRNVYFPDDEAEQVNYPAWPPPKDFLSRWVKGRKVMVIPHHPPIAWGAGIFPNGDGLQFSDLDDEVQPVVEIYSRHGTSEFLNNPRPLRGQIPGCFAQDMLAAGHHFGFIGGSDSHQANPGSSRSDGGPFKTLQYRSGLAAVWARELTRESIWEAIFARRCFATSYPRFVLRFQVNDLFMGQAGIAEYPRRVRIWLASPVDVNQIELIRNNETIHVFAKGGHEVAIEGEMAFDDEEPSGRMEDFYYVRVTSRGGERAWASPIFARRQEQ